MQSFDEDPESGGSQDGSSDDEQTERLGQNTVPDEPEGDDEGEGDGDDDAEGDGEDEEDEEGEAEEEADDSQQADDATPGKRVVSRSGDGAPTSLGSVPALPPDGQSGPNVTVTSPSPQGLPEEPGGPGPRISVREEAISARVYDIVPTIAAPQSTSINVVTATPDLRWVFTGGTDGYIRRFNWLDTANSKLMLTVAQRHPFVDSVTKAGVLVSYWENEEPQAREDGSSLSPVYSLAVQHQALWLLSGLESGGINLQSVRHEEGKRIHLLKKHTSAVSVLSLAQDERSALSGSWDKTVLDWDLDTGFVKRTFADGAGQISVLEMRPMSTLPVPETQPAPVTSGTFSSNNEEKPKLHESNGIEDSINGAGGDDKANTGALSPVDSLFGGGDDDDLFGENNDIAAPVRLGDDDDNEFSRAMAQDLQQDAAQNSADMSMADATVETTQLANGVGTSNDNTTTNGSVDPIQPKQEHDADAMEGVISNGLPHAADDDEHKNPIEGAEVEEAPREQTPTADTTFMAASINGTIRIWDKRQSTPVAKIIPRNTPPWCMGACWSPDGNYIYAGRRNGTVEEFSLHKGLRQAERTFQFPQGSGPVSAVRAMPNGRHLVCASYDILRLYDLHQPAAKHSSVPFLIVPGHRTGVISQLYTDPSCRYLISAAGNRGWEGGSTQVLLGYEINCEK